MIDEGTINMTMSVKQGGCDPIISVGYDACTSWMKQTIDQ